MAKGGSGGAGGRAGRGGGGLTPQEASRLAELESRPNSLTLAELREAVRLQDKRGDPPPGSPPVSAAQQAELALWPDTQRWEAGLNREERQAVEYYQRDGYSIVNDFLRGELPLIPPRERRLMRRHLEPLDDAIGAGRISADVTVYRGVRSESLAALRKGQSFTDQAYVSTSVDKETAASFATGENAAVFRINVPKGSRGVYSQMFGEGELTLYRNARFTITRTGHETINGRRVRVLNLELDPSSQRYTPWNAP